MHDYGKATQKFQNYIRSEEGQIKPDADEFIDAASMRGKIDHSTIGTQILYDRLISRGKRGEIAAQVMAICIASHHSGLINFLSPDGENTFKKRIDKQETRSQLPNVLSIMGDPFAGYSEANLSDIEGRIIKKLQSLKETDSDSRETLLFKHGLLIRFLFSCLIDADRINTADFEFPDNVRLRNLRHYKPWEKLVDRLNQKLSEFEAKTDKNEVDYFRDQVSQACINYAIKPKGIYELTVPTGGGKTLASLRFALNHALHHKLERIFIIIPYTSIIDQNAREIRKNLGGQER